MKVYGYKYPTCADGFRVSICPNFKVGCFVKYIASGTVPDLKLMDLQKLF